MIIIRGMVMLGVYSVRKKLTLAGKDTKQKIQVWRMYFS